MTKNNKREAMKITGMLLALGGVIWLGFVIERWRAGVWAKAVHDAIEEGCAKERTR